MTNKKSRYYSIFTIKRLYALSGNQCAFPGCSVRFLNYYDDTNISNICHIEDANASTHKADRYNPNMSDKERSDYSNLILLCPNHHNETNDPNKYSVEILKEMKRKHEENVEKKLSGINIISQYHSILSILINQIGSSLLEGQFEETATKAPITGEKIMYNNVIRYKPIISEYSIYQGKLNAIYEEIEKQGSSKKSFLLQNFKSLYLSEKGNYIDIESIRENADNILDSIKDDIWNIIENSTNFNTQLPFEAINMSIQIVMVDAFMRCQILEEPI